MVDVIFVVGDGDDEALDAIVEEHEDERESEAERLYRENEHAEGDGGCPARRGVLGREEDSQRENQGNRNAAEQEEPKGKEEQADKDDFGVDGDAAEAVDDQRGEVHFRLAGVAGSAIDLHLPDGQARAENSDGEIVPEIGDADQPAGIRAREQGEIAEGDLSAGEELEEQLIEQDGKLEGEVFRALAAAGDHAEVRQVAGLLEQAGDGVWRIFAVAVHDEDGVGIGVFHGGAEAHGDGALMADVGAEMDDFDALEGFERGGIAEIGGRVDGGAVVDGADGDLERQAGGDTVELAQQNGERIPVIENRDYQPQSAHGLNLIDGHRCQADFHCETETRGNQPCRFLKEYGEYTPGDFRR
jgi:hypothetical protein